MVDYHDKLVSYISREWLGNGGDESQTISEAKDDGRAIYIDQLHGNMPQQVNDNDKVGPCYVWHFWGNIWLIQTS